MAKPISRKLAEQALASVKKQFSAYVELGYEPKLVEAWDGQHWAICWDEGPYEWTYRCPEGGRDLELTLELRSVPGVDSKATVDDPAAPNWPTEVFAEPYDSCVLMLYPA